jgi:hypothetical protein
VGGDLPRSRRRRPRTVIRGSVRILAGSNRPIPRNRCGPAARRAAISTPSKRATVRSTQIPDPCRAGTVHRSRWSPSSPPVHNAARGIVQNQSEQLLRQPRLPDHRRQRTRSNLVALAMARDHNDTGLSCHYALVDAVAAALSSQLEAVALQDPDEIAKFQSHSPELVEGLLVPRLRRGPSTVFAVVRGRPEAGPACVPQRLGLTRGALGGLEPG